MENSFSEKTELIFKHIRDQRIKLLYYIEDYIISIFQKRGITKYSIPNDDAFCLYCHGSYERLYDIEVNEMDGRGFKITLVFYNGVKVKLFYADMELLQGFTRRFISSVEPKI